jgi:hypothetical protein
MLYVDTEYRADASIWTCASLFLGSYTIAQGLSIPLQVQPQAFGALSAVSTAQCLHYNKGHPKKRVVLGLLVFLVFFAGFEVGSVYALRVRKQVA